MAKFYKFDENKFVWECPACECLHHIQTDKSENPCWDFNGDLDAPTVSPSVRVGGTIPITDEEHKKIMSGEPFEPKSLVCHFFIRNGQIEFCSDSTHKLAGKTVEIPDWNK